MLCYSLENNISGEKLLQDINRLIEKFRKNSPDQKPILYIDIKSVTYDDTSLIPKLEHKESNAVDCII